jgi:hypothetical protein
MEKAGCNGESSRVTEEIAAFTAFCEFDIGRRALAPRLNRRTER